VFRYHTNCNFPLGEVEKIFATKGDHKDIKLLLRIHVPDDHSKIPLGSKFGCDPKIAPNLIKTIRDKFNPDVIQVIGISFHVGSGCMHESAFSNAVDIAASVFDEVDGGLVRRRASEASEPFEHPQGQPLGIFESHAVIDSRRIPTRYLCRSEACCYRSYI